MIKLNLGGGPTWSKEDWTNLDICHGYDIEEKLLSEYEDNSVDLIYSAHFIEHIEYKILFILLKDCYRVLKDKGVMRIVTPDLDKIISIYQSGSKELLMQNDPYYKRHKELSLQSIIEEMLGVDSKGYHKAYITKNSLRLFYMLVGFTNIADTTCNVSSVKEFENPAIIHSKTSYTGFDMPTRIDQSLYMEVIK